jgi:pyruvate/2-oxoglutarate dehydrogenase complex dihydrolipoamide acyltransferase (E2) component
LKAADYDIVSFPRSRLATVDLGSFMARKHVMYGLLEVDVTAARRALRTLRRQGQEVSFIAWMIKTIGDCVAQNRRAHAVRAGNKRLVMFHDVDIALPVEREVEGAGVPLPVLIKAANGKTAAQIHAEIQDAIDHSIVNERDFILSEHGLSNLALKLYYALPSALRVFAMQRLFANPFRARRLSGTVTVTTVNAIGKTSGWIVPTRSLHNLFFALGTITRKPWVVNDAVQVREILNLTVAFNHDAIDGVPARRFMQDLVGRIEKG